MTLPARPPIIAVLLFALVAVTFPRSLALKFRDVCPKFGISFIHQLRSQCPRWIDLSPPLQVNGEKFVQKLTTHGSSYKSVLFYAPWCPFSNKALPIFYALNSMFPQVEHLTVEESSVMLSVLSRYGIHSFPAILLANATTTIRYRGPKDIKSLVHFYKKATGMDPIADLVIDQNRDENNKSLRLQILSWREIIKSEPYVACGVIFICLKILAWSVPILYYRAKLLCVSLDWHAYLGFLPGPRQLLQRLLHVFDVKRVWVKIRLCDSVADFRKGANSARVWATSLTSVSLGESSSSRLPHLD